MKKIVFTLGALLVSSVSMAQLAPLTPPPTQSLIQPTLVINSQDPKLHLNANLNPQGNLHVNFVSQDPKIHVNVNLKNLF